MNTTDLSSKRFSVDDDLDAMYDYATEQGWGDGLPIIPPTEARVRRMLAPLGRRPDEVVAILTPRNAPATIEKVAVNAVMAGCKPEYLPAVIAAVEAMADPAFNLYALSTSTNSATPCVIINGPARLALKVNCGYSCFGSGTRANATIGRAVRLVQVNVGGSVAGVTSRSTFGQPGRYTMCLGEWEEQSPWPPLHVRRGFKAEDSTVTVACATGTLDIADVCCKHAADLLTLICNSLNAVGEPKMTLPAELGEVYIFLCPDFARLIAGEGFTVADVQQFMFEQTRAVPLSRFPKDHLAELERRGRIKDGVVATAARPEQFVPVVAGGLGGIHALAIHTFGDTFSVTRPFRLNP